MNKPRHFGISFPIFDLAQEEMLTLHILEEMKKEVRFCPDKIWIIEPIVRFAPIVDRLHPERYLAGEMSYTSEICDYWELEILCKQRRVKESIRYEHCQQRDKFWFTRLCWKLGGFDLPEVKNES